MKKLKLFEIVDNFGGILRFADLTGVDVTSLYNQKYRYQKGKNPRFEEKSLKKVQAFLKKEGYECTDVELYSIPPSMHKKEYLHEKRIEAGLTSKELAKAIGVAPATIYRWVSKQNAPTRPKIEKLKKVFKAAGVDFDIGKMI